jgi:hypothetical protein
MTLSQQGGLHEPSGRREYKPEMPVTERRMKTLLRLGVVASTMCVVTSAFADDKAVCVDAASKGQTSRDEHKLVEARDQFRLCARAVCPAAVRSDCATWLDSVERNLPTVVVTAKSGAGAPLVDVKVSVDGQPLAARLDGEAVPMNPGPHAFHFEAADGTKLDEQMVVIEGQQNQPVAAVLGAPTDKGASQDLSTGRNPSDGPRSSPLRTVGWVAGGIGVVGLGLGTVFGIVAIGDKSSAHCDANNFCDAGPLGSAKSASVVSNVGLIAGGVLLAGGAALVLFSPKGKPEGIASVKVAPAVAPGSGGLVLGGTW